MCTNDIAIILHNLRFISYTCNIKQIQTQFTNEWVQKCGILQYQLALEQERFFKLYLASSGYKQQTFTSGDVSPS